MITKTHEIAPSQLKHHNHFLKNIEFFSCLKSENLKIHKTEFTKNINRGWGSKAFIYALVSWSWRSYLVGFSRWPRADHSRSLRVYVSGRNNHFLYFLNRLANLKNLQHFVPQLKHCWRLHPLWTLAQSSLHKHHLCTVITLFPSLHPQDNVLLTSPSSPICSPTLLYLSLYRTHSHHASGDTVWDYALTCHIMSGVLCWKARERGSRGVMGSRDEHMGCTDNPWNEVCVSACGGGVWKENGEIDGEMEEQRESISK